MKFVHIFAIAFVTISAFGCAASASREDFGNSVRHMVQSQKAHPEISANPDEEGVDGTDAERVVKVLETYRNDIANPVEVSEPIIVNIGGARE